MPEQRIGTCSLCGGDVVGWRGAWMATVPPPKPHCATCGAIAVEDDPVIAMRPKTQKLFPWRGLGRLGRTKSTAAVVINLLAALSLSLSLCACGTLAPPKPIQTGDAVGTLRRFLVAATTHATMKDDAFEGVNVESADLADGAVDGVLQNTLPPLIADALRAAANHSLIEARGPRVWAVKLTGETAPRWFIARPKVANGLSELEVNAPVMIWARRYEILGLSVTIVHRWSRK